MSRLLAGFATTAVLTASALVAATGIADDGYRQALQRSAIAGELHKRSEWLNLGHYSARMTGGHVSRAVSPTFFFAANGRADPAAELSATLDAFFRPTDPDLENAPQHPQCAFPARFEWISEVLAIDRSRLPQPRCAAFDKWYAEVAPSAATLIFAANFLNNPSSMFGHTLLRIDKAGAGVAAGVVLSPLNSYAINYTTQASDDNAIAFTIKSFIGQYPGYFSLLPYYEKVKEYSDFESRDLWEYALALDAGEVRRLVRHAWELDRIRFDYYFLDENCAYQLLALIEVARPGKELTRKARAIVIPSDTVRLLADQGMIRQATYRASRQSRIRHALAQLDVRGRDIAFRLASDMTPAALQGVGELAAPQRTIALDAAYEYLQHRYTYFAQERRPVAERAMAILAEQNRTATQAVSAPSSPPVPERPDTGHGTRSVGLAAGRAEAAGAASPGFVDLRLRNGYHDFLDPSNGFAEDAKINFFDLLIRHGTADRKTRIEDFRLIEVQTIAPHDRFFSQRSWTASAGLTRSGPLRDLATGAQRTPPLGADFRGGRGLAVAPADRVIVFAQPEIHLVHHTRFVGNLAAGAGARVGLQLALPARGKVFATTSSLRYHDLPEWRGATDVGIGYGISRNLSLQLFVHRERAGTAPTRFDEIKAGVAAFF